MLVGGMVTQNVWFTPWAGASKAVFVQAFLLEDGEIGSVKYKPGEEDETAEMMAGYDIVAEGKPVLLEPKAGRFVKHRLCHGSWLLGNPEINTEHETMSLFQCAAEAAGDAARRIVWAFRDLARKIAAFRHRRHLNVDFRPVPAESDMRGLWVSECPLCRRQIVLEETDYDPDPDDPIDTNLIVWLEGSYMGTHHHPATSEQAEEKAADILLSHLRAGCDSGRIEIEDGFMPETQTSASWGLEAWRNSDGELDVRCSLCRAGTYFDSDSTMYQAENWALEHDCGDREEAGLMRTL